MARSADPERIHQARRAAVRNTLTGSGNALETAARWCDAWAFEAALETSEEWIAAERAARRPAW